MRINYLILDRINNFRLFRCEMESPHLRMKPINKTSPIKLVMNADAYILRLILDCNDIGIVIPISKASDDIKQSLK